MVKKILICFVMVLFIYILTRLLYKRSQIITKKVEGFVEGIAPLYTDSTVKKIVAATPAIGIKDAKAAYGSQPIQNFFVKASLDSAYNGSTVSVDMVNYVLSRGYRFVDFEVYLEPLTTASPGSSPIAVVGFSQYGNYPRMSSNNIKLNDVITAIMQGAFTSTSPNASDPLFLQIRPMYQIPAKSDDPRTSSAKMGKNTQLNTQIEVVLDQLKPMLAGPIESTTSLVSISGKIVLIMDSTKSYGPKSEKLLSMISIDPRSKKMTTSNTGIVTATPSVTPTVSPSSIPSSPASLVAVLPFDNNGVILSDNPDPNSVITQFTPNFSPVMAWLSSSALLATYETLFTNNGNSAFIEVTNLKENASSALVLNSPIVGPS